MTDEELFDLVAWEFIGNCLRVLAEAQYSFILITNDKIVKMSFDICHSDIYNKVTMLGGKDCWLHHFIKKAGLGNGT